MFSAMQYKRLFIATILQTVNAATAAPVDLTTVYRQAAESSPSIAQASARLNAEQAGKNIARSALAPRLVAAGSLSQNDLDLSGFGPAPINESYTPAGYSVTLTQPLVNGAALSALQAARSKVQGYEAALSAVRQDLILQTAEAYFGVLRAEALERTALSQLALLQETKERAEGEHRAGTGDIIAVEEACARLAGAQAERLAARNRVELARRALERLTHQPADALADLIQLEPQGPVPDRMEDWVGSAVGNQPALAQARQELQANRDLATAAGRGAWPVVSLQAQYSDANDTFIPGMDRRESLVGIGAVWPIFQGGETRAAHARATALAQASQYGVEALEDKVRLDTQRAFLDLENSVALLGATRHALDSAETALAATQKGREIGSRSVVDVLDSARRRADAESNYYQALYNQVLARLRLKASAGILTEKDVHAINQLLTPGTQP
jgi:outer membrane protein